MVEALVKAGFIDDASFDRQIELFARLQPYRLRGVPHGSIIAPRPSRRARRAVRAVSRGV